MGDRAIAPRAVADRLFWSISPEQGRGNGGISRQEYPSNNFTLDLDAIGGDLEVLALSSYSTTVEY